MAPTVSRSMKCAKLLAKWRPSIHVLFTATNYILNSFLLSKSQSVLKKMSESTFPKTLRDFGYAFNEGKRLCNFHSHYLAECRSTTAKDAHVQLRSSCFMGSWILGGKLRKIDTESGLVTNDPFEFNVSEDQAYNQKRYEALGEVSIRGLGKLDFSSFPLILREKW